jgi:ABC-type multidrug transport system ATPase subunit
MYCIETKNLKYRFPGGATVLNDINLQVPQGAIYGFLGPNGAGKTTTLRLLLGLLRKQEGTIRVFNKEFTAHRVDILKSVGSLIETPSIYAHLDARQNLEVFRLIYGSPRSRVNEVLEIVGLSGTGKKKAGKFSLGMKQRLSIAIALLNSPRLLILDEPTNGLDPNGIIEIRELLQELNSRMQMTILISSHLLSEIEKLVTHTGIIHKGSLIFQGPLQELHARQNQSSLTLFRTGDPETALEIIKANHILPATANNVITIPLAEAATIAYLNQQLVAHDIPVYEISTVTNDLESIFIDLVNN